MTHLPEENMTALPAVWSTDSTGAKDKQDIFAHQINLKNYEYPPREFINTIYYNYNQPPQVRIKRLSESAITPTKREGDAGYDLYADEDCKVWPESVTKIPTNIAMEIPPGYFGAIYARSGLATKQGLRPANCVGICDSVYRGNIIVALYNDSGQVRQVKKGDRIAQLVIQPYLTVDFAEVDKLNDTERGEEGFGSTGI